MISSSHPRRRPRTAVVSPRVAALSTSIALIIGVTAVGPRSVHAQSAPDAGALRQQIERDLPTPRTPPSPPPLQSDPVKPAAVAPGDMLTVQRFAFVGRRLLSEERLQAVVQGWVGRPIGFGDLQAAVLAVADAYRAEGYVVRTLLPRQDVTEGTVTIQVIESRFDGVRLEGQTPTRIGGDAIRARILAQQAVDAPLQLDALDRGLLLADDLPGVSVTGALEPGARDGRTGLALRTQDGPLVTGEAGLDNSGSRSTGSARATGNLTLNSPLRIGDRARVDGQVSQGSRYVRGAYDLPIGAGGWRAGVNLSWLDYRLVADEFDALNGRGRSSSVGLDASYPLIRSRLRNLYVTSALDSRRFHNDANQATQSDYGVHSLALGLSGNLYDGLGGGGLNTAMLTWTVGRVRQSTLDVGENPALAGGYGKLRYAVSREQTLTQNLSLFAALSGQHAGSALDSSERFYLGGPQGVRAYPVNEGAGSRGQLASLEVRWRLPAGLTTSAFYDWGHVSALGVGNDVTLKGAGVALGWRGPQGIQAKATVAVRDGHNPNPTASGSDQDGSLHRTRLWLQLSMPF